MFHRTCSIRLASVIMSVSSFLTKHILRQIQKNDGAGNQRQEKIKSPSAQ